MLCLRGYFATPSHPRLFLHPQKLSACPSSEGKRALATGSAFDSLQEGVISTSNLSRLWRRLPRRGGFSLPATGAAGCAAAGEPKGKSPRSVRLVRTNAVVSPLASGVRRGSHRVQTTLTLTWTWRIHRFPSTCEGSGHRRILGDRGEGNAPTSTTRRCHRFLLRIACLAVQPPTSLPSGPLPSHMLRQSAECVSGPRGIQDGLSTIHAYQSSAAGDWSACARNNRGRKCT